MMNESPKRVELSAKDREILDAIAEKGFDPSAIEDLPSDDRERAQAICGLFALLEDYPVEDPDEALVGATIARVHRLEESRAVVGRIEAEPAPNRWRIRVPDLISVAAVILIAASITIPLLGHVRQRAVDVGCVANLRTIGDAFQSYAQQFDGRVPMAVAGFGMSPGAPRWVDPYELARLGYCEHGHANCPGHSKEAGYSRQIIIRPDREFGWFTGGPVEPVMSDRNPIIDARMAELMVDPYANAREHGGRGQNVLFNDGATRWLEHPVLNPQGRADGDNIWLVNGQSSYVPGVVPQTTDDAFLAH